MATLIFGVLILALVLWALNAFTKVPPRTAAVVLKTGGGLGALALAGVLGVRGRLDVAIPLGLTGLGLLGWLPWSIPGFGARTQKSSGQVSRVRAAFVEMELDHDTGAMRGRILAGPHEGTSLDALGGRNAYRLPDRHRRGKPRATYGVSRPPGAPLA